MTSDIEWHPALYDDDCDNFQYNSDSVTGYNSDSVSMDSSLPVSQHDSKTEYGEEFEEHELNVYSCLKHAQKSDKILDTTSDNIDSESPLDSESDPKQPKLDIQGLVVPPHSILPKKTDFEKLRPYFAWLPIDRIKNTLKNTTQWFKAEGCIPM